jgi:N-dimethylarginine dimethylaminohydrolase
MLNEYAPLRRVALRHPADLFRNQDYVTAHWRHHDFEAEPDYRRTVAQYETFVAHLRDSGADLVFPDFDAAFSMAGIYARDSAILTPDGVVPGRMANAYREPEPDIDARVYANAGYALYEGIRAPGTLEGGDVVWFDETLCAVGRGYRSNAAGIAQFRARLGPDVHVEVMDTPHFRGPGFCLHLGSVLSPVDADLAVVYSPLIPIAFRRWLQEARGLTLVEVPEEEFDLQGANVLALAPRKVMLAEGCPVTEKRLEAAGCEVVAFPAHEICVLGVGGPTCLTRPLERG